MTTLLLLYTSQTYINWVSCFW